MKNKHLYCHHHSLHIQHSHHPHPQHHHLYIHSTADIHFIHSTTIRYIHIIAPPSTTTTTPQLLGPSGQTSEPLKKRRRQSKLDKVERLNQSMFNMFLASQEESRKEFMALVTSRLEMEEEQRKGDAERDKMFLTFMKDTLAMMIPPPSHMYSMPPGAYPPVIPTPPGPTQRGHTEEDSEEEI